MLELEKDEPEYLRVMRRTGRVLLAIGLLDIGVMIYCMATGTSYSSSLNLFAVIAGVFLIRGSLRAAAVVRFMAVFYGVMFAALRLILAVMQPLDLTVTQLRLAPFAALGTAAMMLALVGLIGAVVWSLGHPSIAAARAAAGKKRRGIVIPAAIGLVAMVSMVVGTHYLLNGDSAARALREAASVGGPAYRYAVTSLSIKSSGGESRVSGVVTAWNEREIRSIPVGWSE
ncbi:MAG TPA: hypothetical protein VFT37_09460 [Telluria sp.]|nr:hypothetical protein [Telluria sp.]